MLRRHIARSFIFLFLAAFGWVQAENAVHGLLHRHDRQCTSTDQHIHEKEHHCFACDMNVSAADVHTPARLRISPAAVVCTYTAPVAAAVIPRQAALPALRGPPVFS